MTTPTIMIKSMIMTVTTMMTVVGASEVGAVGGKEVGAVEGKEVDAVEGKHTCGISCKKIHDSTNYNHVNRLASSYCLFWEGSKPCALQRAEV